MLVLITLYYQCFLQIFYFGYFVFIVTKSLVHIRELKDLSFWTTDMCTELASQLVDILFKTLCIYDDRGSRKAVDDVITKALRDVIFMKSFAAALVQTMEKQAKFQTHVGCYRLLQWSCILLSKSAFATVSKNAFCRVATAQTSLLHFVMKRSFHERRACKRTFLHLFFQV